MATKDEFGNSLGKEGNITKYAIPKDNPYLDKPKIEKTPPKTLENNGDSGGDLPSFNLPNINDPNKLILVGGIIIISTGFIYAANSGRPETPVLAGGVGFLLLASLLDALGGGWSKLAVGLVGLATVSVLLVEGPAIFQAISNTRNHTPTVTANDTGSGSIQVPTTPTHSGGSQVM